MAPYLTSPQLGNIDSHKHNSGCVFKCSISNHRILDSISLVTPITGKEKVYYLELTKRLYMELCHCHRLYLVSENLASLLIASFMVAALMTKKIDSCQEGSMVMIAGNVGRGIDLFCRAIFFCHMICSFSLLWF